MKLFCFRYINILREIIENNFPFSREFGRPFFVLWASQDAWTPFWLKAWLDLYEERLYRKNQQNYPVKQFYLSFAIQQIKANLVTGRSLRIYSKMPDRTVNFGIPWKGRKMWLVSFIVPEHYWRYTIGYLKHRFILHGKTIW